MPMIDYSTLFYFVNNIQNKFEKETRKMDCGPSGRTIKNILDFARSYDTVETKSAGYVEMNLN